MSVILISRGKKQGFKADDGKPRRLEEEGAKEGSRGAMATLGKSTTLV